MNCLWLILILACCQGTFCGSNQSDDDGCGNGVSRRGNGRRERDCDCDCGRPVTSMPPFGRGAESDTCGCDIQES